MIIVYIGIGTDGVGTVAAATKQLQQRYISSRFLSSVDEWPPYQPKHYTTLAFIHNKGKHTDAVRFSVAQELAVAGKIHTAQPYKLSDLNINMTKNISDIFLPVKAPDGSFIDLHILIEGAPGIGKTVLAKEIAFQWAKSELLISKKLLLLVFLRECSQTNLRSIEQLVQYIFRNDETASHLTNYLSKAEGEGTVIVFDGFDELSEENRKNSIIVDIINRRILAKSCLVVTSRHTASSYLHASVDRRVVIVGFTEEDRLNYIQTALENSDEQVKAYLQYYLQSNPTINALCYIPFNMTILLCLVKDEIDMLPRTQTEMYKKFIDMTIVRFIKKCVSHSLIVNIADLPHPHDKLLVELAKLAYKGLKVDKIVFTLFEIKEGCPNLTMTSSNWNGLGLLKAVRYFSVEMGNDQVTFHFLHFSIQEYLAAWYISTLSNKKQIKLLKETFWEHRYYNTWIMYIGITSGSSFALRHFLSGNWFQFYSKLFNSSKVSKRYLKNKMRCLHLFQCLVEANKEDIIVSVKQLFQSNRIDLSNQTLLPHDLNTLSFFLIRSINKEWDELDLSNCNIGSEGSNILCDRLLDKDVRDIVTIKMINFSYNQLNLSSLRQLFGLFNSWHTSEIFITDDAILNNKADNKAIEDVVLQSDTLVLVFIGSYLYSRNLQLSKMIHILSNTINIKSIYLLDCSWKSRDFRTSELLMLLKKQALNKVRIISSSLDIVFIISIALILFDNSDSVNMLVYDPTMSDEIADDISSLIASSSKEISGVMLIVSSSKVQGIVNTCTLSSELSALEVFNLCTYVRLFNSKMCSWRHNFEGKNYNKEIIVYTFVEMLYVIKSDWKLEISMIQDDVLIAYKAKFDNIKKYYNNKISMIYYSSCDVYDIVDKSCSVIHSLNSPDCVKLLCTKPLHKHSVPNELFIYGNIEDSLMNSVIELMSHHHHNISAVLAANDVIVGFYPNIQQIALAFKLQPSTTKLVLCSPISAIVFHQVVDALVILHTEWIELDFTCCNIGDIECEIMHRNLTCTNHSSTAKKLNISCSKLTVSGIPYLVRIVLILRVQELNINGTDDVLYDCLIKNLTSRGNHQYKFFLSITYSNKLLHIICNTSLNEIAIKMKSLVFELYIVNCELKVLEIISYLNISHNLLRLCVINGTVSETIVIEILKRISNKVVEVSISNVRIIDDDRALWNLLTSRKYHLDIKLNLLLSTNHWLCACNATKYQLHLIHQYFMNQTQPHCYGMNLIRKLEQINGDKMYIFENDLVNLVRLRGKVHQTTGVTHVTAALSHTTSLNTIEIDNYTITSEAANHLTNIIHNNNQLQEISLNANDLQTDSTTKIAKALYCIQAISFCNNYVTEDTTNNSISITGETILEITGSIITSKAVSLHDDVTLTKLCISNNYIIDEAADDIAIAISYNIHLQELNLGSNDLRTSGTVKIAKSLQKISSLTKLYINHNNITHEAADDIAAVIFSSVKLQEFDVSGNNLQMTGAIKIVKALKGISTLRKLYLSNVNISDEVADDIAAAISCNTQIEVLDVSGNNIKAMGAMKIGENLQHIYTPKTLFISNNNNIAADDVAAVISGNACLQELYICRKNIQTTGAKVIIKALQGTRILTKIHFGNNIISDEAANDIAAVVSSNTKLKEIEISGSKLQTTGAIKIMKVLQGIFTLEKLYLNNNNINEEAADDIAAAISCNIYLQELNISKNDLQTSGNIKIARSLQKISSLAKLYISHNNITHEAADDIAAAISCNIHLQELNFGSNKLHTSGAIKIARSLQKISSITKLYINHNNMTHEAADDIAAAISCNIHLQELNISKNDLQTSGNMKIARSLQKISSLVKLYISHNNITHEAADDIAAAISCNIHLQELNFGSNKLHTSGAIKISRSLQKISSLTKLYINHNNITHEAADDIAIAISCNINLQELNISKNDLQTSGNMKIARSLQKISSLVKLYISHNNITHEAADDIAAVISCNIHLQELNFGSNNLQTSGAIKIARSLQKISSLTKLYINHNNITHEAADDIAAAISCNIHLQELNFGSNKLHTSGAIKIARSLQKISSLTKLYINHNNITHEAADDIAAAISCNIHLQELNLGNNNLQTSGIIKIVRYLQEISLLQKLYIHHNNITDEAAEDIGTIILCNNHLQELNLDKNNLQTSGTIKIAKSLQKILLLTKLYISHNNITHEAADDIAAAISCNIHLQELNLGSNNLQTSGTIKIAKCLQKISSLIKLYINHNNITHEAADDIAAAISCNAKLQEVDISRNNLQTIGVIKILKALKGISTLRKLYLSNVNISDEVADDIVAVISCNTQIEVLDVSGNNIKAMGAMKIGENLQHIYTPKTLFISNNNNIAADDVAAIISGNACLQELYICRKNLHAKAIIKALQGTCALTKMHFANNNITDEAADDIAAVVSSNTKLKEIEISESKLQTTGAIKIMKVLQGICTLEKLYLNNNNINEEAADDIATAISCNIHLQELNLGSNYLHTLGTIKIAESLQKFSSLTKLCINHNNITHEAADDIAAAISCNIHLQELNISKNDLQTSGNMKIARSLQKISSLVKLYISHNNITHKAADDIAAVISCNIHLQELNFGSNKLHTSGAIKIARSLQKISSLTKLYLNHNNITHEAADDIAAAISCNIHLQELNLGNNDLQTSGIIKIARNLQEISLLKKLYIHHNNITDEAAEDIGAIILCNNHLQELNIGKNDLQTSGNMKIAKSLQKISSLTKLYISHNNITHEAADDIAAAISCNIHLQELNLGSNNLQASGTIKIVRCLQEISSLTKIYINHNNITHEAADDIAAAISCNIHLQELNLGSNNLQTSGTIKIAKCLQKISSLIKIYINHNNITHEAADDIAAAISCNAKLQEVDISRNNLQTTGVIKILKALKGISTLRKLYLSNVNISDEVADDIAAVISCNTQIKVLDVSGNNIKAMDAMKTGENVQHIYTSKTLFISNTNNIAADDVAADACL